MSELVEWLRAQLDDDERAAQAADVKQGDPEWFVSPIRAAPGNFTIRSKRDMRPIARVQHLDGDEDDPVILDGAAAADHIARHDPARVLREVEAKRKILDEHQSGEVKSYYDEAEKRYVMETVCLMCVYTYDDEDAGGNRRQYREHAEWPCLTVQYLAEVYSDRPGYQEDWRP